MANLRGGSVEMSGVVMEGEVTVNGEEFVDGVHIVHARRVLLITAVAACASAIGVLPVLFLRRAPTRLVMGRMLAMACGILLTACGILIFSAVQKHALSGAMGLAVGVTLVVATKRALTRRDDEMLKSEIFGGESGDDGLDGSNDNAAPLPIAVGRIGEKHLEDGSGRRTVLTLLVMAIYGSVEGMGVGVSFGGGEDLGNMVSAAVMMQNLPEGLLCGLLLLPRLGRLRALLWTILVHLGQPVAATAAFLFEKRFISALPACLGIAGGAVAVMCAEIGSEAASKLSRLHMIACMVGSAALFLLFELQIHQWKGSAVNVIVSN